MPTEMTYKIDLPGELSEFSGGSLADYLRDKSEDYVSTYLPREFFPSGEGSYFSDFENARLMKNAAGEWIIEDSIPSEDGVKKTVPLAEFLTQTSQDIAVLELIQRLVEDAPEGKTFAEIKKYIASLEGQLLEESKRFFRDCCIFYSSRVMSRSEDGVLARLFPFVRREGILHHFITEYFKKFDQVMPVEFRTESSQSAIQRSGEGAYCCVQNIKCKFLSYKQDGVLVDENSFCEGMIRLSYNIKDGSLEEKPMVLLSVAEHVGQKLIGQDIGAQGNGNSTTSLVFSKATPADLMLQKKRELQADRDPLPEAVQDYIVRESVLFGRELTPENIQEVVREITTGKSLASLAEFFEQIKNNVGTVSNQDSEGSKLGVKGQPNRILNIYGQSKLMAQALIGWRFSEFQTNSTPEFVKLRADFVRRAKEAIRQKGEAKTFNSAFNPSSKGDERGALTFLIRKGRVEFQKKYTVATPFITELLHLFDQAETLFSEDLSYVTKAGQALIAQFFPNYVQLRDGEPVLEGLDRKEEVQVSPLLLVKHVNTVFSETSPFDTEMTREDWEKALSVWLARTVSIGIFYLQAVFNANPDLFKQLKDYYGKQGYLSNERVFLGDLINTLTQLTANFQTESIARGLREDLGLSNNEEDSEVLKRKLGAHPLRAYTSRTDILIQAAVGGGGIPALSLPEKYQGDSYGALHYLVYLLVNMHNPETLMPEDLNNRNKLYELIFNPDQAKVLFNGNLDATVSLPNSNMTNDAKYKSFCRQLEAIKKILPSYYAEILHGIVVEHRDFCLELIRFPERGWTVKNYTLYADMASAIFANAESEPEKEALLKLIPTDRYSEVVAAIFANAENEPKKEALFKLIPKDRYPMIGNAAETFKEGARQDFCASAVRVAVKDYLQTKWGIASDLVSFESLPKKLQVRRNIAAAYQILELLKGLEAHPEAYDYVMSQVKRFQKMASIYGERLGGLKQSSTFAKSLDFKIAYDGAKAASIPHDFSATKETADDINTDHVDANKWFSRYFFKKLKNFIARESAAFSLGSLGAVTLIMGVLIVVAALAFPPLAIPLLAGVGWAAAFGIGLAIVGGLALFGSFLTGYGTNAKVRIKDKLGEAPQPTVTPKVSDLSTNTQQPVVPENRRLGVTSSNSGSPIMLDVVTPPASPNASKEQKTTGQETTEQKTTGQETALSEEQQRRPVSPLGSKQ